jgi:hypothetical protein
MQNVVTPITEIKTDVQLDELYKSVAEGIVTLQQHSEAFGDNVSTNRARLLFYALSVYLDDNGVLEHLTAAVNFSRSPVALLECYPPASFDA